MVFDTPVASIIVTRNGTLAPSEGFNLCAGIVDLLLSVKLIMAIVHRVCMFSLYGVRRDDDTMYSFGGRVVQGLHQPR